MSHDGKILSNGGESVPLEDQEESNVQSLQENDEKVTSFPKKNSISLDSGALSTDVGGADQDGGSGNTICQTLSFTYKDVQRRPLAIPGHEMYKYDFERSLVLDLSNSQLSVNNVDAYLTQCAKARVADECNSLYEAMQMCLRNLDRVVPSIEELRQQISKFLFFNVRDSTASFAYNLTFAEYFKIAYKSEDADVRIANEANQGFFGSQMMLFAFAQLFDLGLVLYDYSLSGSEFRREPTYAIVYRAVGMNQPTFRILMLQFDTSKNEVLGDRFRFVGVTKDEFSPDSIIALPSTLPELVKNYGWTTKEVSEFGDHLSFSCLCDEGKRSVIELASKIPRNNKNFVIRYVLGLHVCQEINERITQKHQISTDLHLI